MYVKRPILCYVTDSAALDGRVDVLLERIGAAARAGVDWIQVREKTMQTRQLHDLVRAAAERVRSESQEATRIIVNHRLDVALSARVGGVHLGGTSLPVAGVVQWLHRESNRLRLSRDFLVGRSCHSLAEARQAESDGASYVVFGPIFQTPSKKAFGAPLGVGQLAETCQVLGIPVLAIGGVNVENASDCFHAGAAGIAAIRLFQDCTDFAGTMQLLRIAG